MLYHEVVATRSPGLQRSAREPSRRTVSRSSIRFASKLGKPYFETGRSREADEDSGCEISAALIGWNP